MKRTSAPSRALQPSTHPLVAAGVDWGFSRACAEQAIRVLQQRSGGTSVVQLTAATHQNEFLEICMTLQCQQDGEPDPAGAAADAADLSEDAVQEEGARIDSSDNDVSNDGALVSSSDQGSSSEGDDDMDSEAEGLQGLQAGQVEAASARRPAGKAQRSPLASHALTQGEAPITWQELEDGEDDEELPPQLAPPCSGAQVPHQQTRGINRRVVLSDSDVEAEIGDATTLVRVKQSQQLQPRPQQAAAAPPLLTPRHGTTGYQSAQQLTTSAAHHAHHGTTQAAAAGGGAGGGGAQRLPAFAGTATLSQGLQRGALTGVAGQAATAQEAAAAAADDAMGLAEMVNKRVFGNHGWRESQRDVVHAALTGHSVFVLMPTGGGKSLCYQLPAVMGRGVTAVVCPLLSLMQDQVQALCKGRPGGCGVPAAYLSSAQSRAEALAVLRELNKPSPTCKLLYVTPEQLVKSGVLSDILRRLHARGRLARFVIDEAHCVSMWGHDFRPDYQQLGGMIKAQFPNIPITAVTATATERVANDIMDTLGIRHTAKRFQVSFFRQNLHFSVRDKEYGMDELERPQPLASLIDFIQDQNAMAASRHVQQPGRPAPLQTPPPSGIVYCLSRDESEQVARALQELGGISAHHYHAGMTSKQRMKVQSAWQAGRIQVVVATIAFGMGIDKPDVRFVAHYTLSKSLEGYFQEAGRAGRDGLPSECVLFYAKRDNPRILNLLRQGKGSSYQTGLAQLESMKAFCEELKRCRHHMLLDYFCDPSRDVRLGNGCEGCCDNCCERASAGSGGRAAARAAAVKKAKQEQRKKARKSATADGPIFGDPLSDGDDAAEAGRQGGGYDNFEQGYADDDDGWDVRRDGYEPAELQDVDDVPLQARVPAANHTAGLAGTSSADAAGWRQRKKPKSNAAAAAGASTLVMGFQTAKSLLTTTEAAGAQLGKPSGRKTATTKAGKSKAKTSSNGQQTIAAAFAAVGQGAMGARHMAADSHQHQPPLAPAAGAAVGRAAGNSAAATSGLASDNARAAAAGARGSHTLAVKASVGLLSLGRGSAGGSGQGSVKLAPSTAAGAAALQRAASLQHTRLPDSGESAVAAAAAAACQRSSSGITAWPLVRNSLGNRAGMAADDSRLKGSADSTNISGVLLSHKTADQGPLDMKVGVAPKAIAATASSRAEQLALKGAAEGTKQRAKQLLQLRQL